MEIQPHLPQSEGFDGVGQPLFDELGAFRGNTAQVFVGRRGGKYKRERNQRKAQPGDPRRKEHVIHVRHVESEEVEGDVFERFDVFECCECK